MKVRELREKLEKLPGDLDIEVTGVTDNRPERTPLSDWSTFYAVSVPETSGLNIYLEGFVQMLIEQDVVILSKDWETKYQTKKEV
jgi:hypothetical protein